MGLFSSTKTYVSSTIYNLAGDIKDRPNFLKTLMAGRTINGGNQSSASIVTTGYVNGPGMKIRRFANWAVDNYDIVGVPQGNLYSTINVKEEAVGAEIPHDVDEEVFVSRVEVKLADYAFWAEQYMLANYPDEVDDTWVSDYDEDNDLITISLASGITIDFTPSGFDKDGAYIYALYTTLMGEQTGPTVIGSVVTLGSSDPYPSTAGWTSTSTILTPTPQLLTKVVKTTKSYSDGRPNEVNTVTTTSTPTWNYYRGVYTKTVYKGSNEIGTNKEIYSVKSTMRLYRDASVATNVSSTTVRDELSSGTVIRTTLTETTEEVLVVVPSYRIDTQEIVHSSESKPELFIYQLGSGNDALDDLVENAHSEDGFYIPYIPVRLDNKFLSETFQPSGYEMAKKAYKKVTTGDLDDLIESVATSESLKDIDYAYVMLGVPLNTKEKAGKEYLYRFFEKLMISQSSDRDDYEIWKTVQEENDAAVDEWVDWYAGQGNPLDPMFGLAEPLIPGSYSPPSNEIRIRGNGTLSTNLDMQITWSAIQEDEGSGLKKPDAKVGEYWIELGGQTTVSDNIAALNGLKKKKVKAILQSQFTIYWQVDEDNWKSLNVVGAFHKNYIYKGKFVETDAQDALTDSEESQFLIPIHYGTFKEMGMVASTQLATSCAYMVINSYLVKKTGFFGSTFFKILLVVVVIAITIAFPPAGGFGAGILGPAATVGAAIGLTGLAAIIAGAIANAIVAMIISKLLTVVSVAVFGEKFGAIIGAIASFVALSVGTSMANAPSFQFETILRPENLIKLTSSVGDGVAGIIAADVQKYAKRTQEILDDYRDQSTELAKRYEEEFGYDRALLDPMAFLNNQSYYLEGRDSFLSRTLMTGSDIADLSSTMLTNFADINLSTELQL